MTALARWRRMKEQEERGPIARRPHDVRECKSLADADRFRRENPGLGEFKIRDLNDDINKMLRVKHAWEARIKELGGPDYRRIAPRELDAEGREVASSRGYKYFGAAKDLPGVRELFQQQAEEEGPPKRSRADLVRNIDAHYYGYMDDDDGCPKWTNEMKDDESTLVVRGYSSRLFSHDAADPTEDSLLIPWQGDEELLVDRYDVRLYLNDLSAATIGSNDAKREEVDESPEETIEEELTTKEADEREEDDGISGGSDDEAEGPYKPPDVLKIPVGTNLPSNVRLGHLIERTARFVAHNGNQMEIVIKAKHRKDQHRFRFDNPLNPFYKFLCKAIREKKWDPPPPAERRLPGEHFVPNRPAEEPKKKRDEEEEDGSDSDSDGEGYLHPLLMANRSARNSSFVNLYEQLHADAAPEPPTTSKAPAVPLVLAPEEKPALEEDPLEARNYEQWHLPFAPQPPPPLSSPPDDLLAQINTLAKYVATNGPPAEQQAIEHNKWSLEFFFPDSKHHITYHNRVRYYLTQTGRTNLPPFVRSKYHPAEPVFFRSNLSPSVRPEPPTSLPPVPKAPTPPVPPVIRPLPPADGPPVPESEKIKQIRKERAQQFMSDLLRQKTLKPEPSAPPPPPPKEPEIVVPADVVVPSLIQKLVGTQLQRMTAADRPSREGSREARERPAERRRRSRTRSRSRSSFATPPSFPQPFAQPLAQPIPLEAPRTPQPAEEKSGSRGRARTSRSEAETSSAIALSFPLA
ncbi:hypothetical protein M3Y99_01744600 [Aphelenchoides fujianensis]|nr:hypothetical protein M3Y99_01744600 [Aphelenchoides fujianensis]